MSALSLRLPDSIHNHIREVAKKEGVSINKFISATLAEKVSVMLTDDYLKGKALRDRKNECKKILGKAPDRNSHASGLLQKNS